MQARVPGPAPAPKQALASEQAPLRAETAPTTKDTVAAIFQGDATRLLASLKPGDLVLLEGPNGSGKTTLLRRLAGLPPFPGMALSRDETAPSATSSPSSSPMSLSSSPNMHFLAQDPRDTLVGLTVGGEFRLRSLALPHDQASRVKQDVATLSSGQARLLGLTVARTALEKSAGKELSILLLDEPAEGLDSASQAELLQLVAATRARGAVVAVDHTGILRTSATRRLHLGAMRSSQPTHAVRPPLSHLSHPSLSPLSHPLPPILHSNPDEAVLGGRKLHFPALSLGPGLHALAGPNGSGKSTLLLRLSGLRRGGGNVRIDGQPPVPGGNVRLLLPRARELLVRTSVRGELQGTEPAACDLLVPDHMLDRHPMTLSGGEAQRVALAKVLGRLAPLYLLDEPEAHLDEDGLRATWDLVRLRVSQGSCILAATHDARIQAEAQEVVLLDGTSASVSAPGPAPISAPSNDREAP